MQYLGRESVICEIKQRLLNMIIIYISWCFPNIFLDCEWVVSDISYTQRDAMRKPDLQRLEPLRPAWTYIWVVTPLHGGTPPKLAVPLPRHLNTLDHQGAIQPEGCVCPSSVSLCDSCKGFCQGLCAAKAQIPSGWEQPGFPLLPAFLLLVMQMTSPHDAGTELRKCWWCK